MHKFFLLIIAFLLFVRLDAQNIDINLLKKHVYTLADDSLMGRGFGTQGGRMAANYIENQFRDAGIQPWQGRYMHHFINSRMMFKTEGCNIIGWVEGADSILKNEYVVVGAHYDHLAYYLKGDSMVVYNGADDNASGTATIIELGRWLSKNRDQLKRSVILIAFDGEESGLIGSTYIVNNNIIPVDRVKMMFSLDMVGMLSKYGGIDVVGNSTLNDGEKLIDEIAAKHNIKVKEDGKRIEMQTDTSPFGKKGIPSVHVFTSTVSPYHQPQDDANLVDYDGLAKIAEFMKDLVVRLSDSQILVPDSQFLTSIGGKGFRPKFGFKVGLGSAGHNYKDEYFYGKTVFAFNAGLYSEIRLSKQFSLQPELLYQSRGSEHTWGTLRTHEFTVPLNIRMKVLSIMEDLVENQAFLFAGPYYSYRFAGKVGANRMDFDKYFTHEEVGIQYGLGFSIMKTQLILTNSISFKSIDKNSNVMQHSTIISLGFRF